MRDFEEGGAVSISDEVVEEGETGLSRTRAVAIASKRSGPLPSPRDLAEYDQACPGLADRIARMAEKEGEHRREVEVRDATHRRTVEAEDAAHRRSMELAQIQTENRIRRSGQAMGFSLVLALMVGSFVMFALGLPAVGIATLVPAVGGIIVSWRKADKHRDEAPPAKPADSKAGERANDADAKGHEPTAEAKGDKAKGDKAKGDKAKGDKAKGDKAKGDKAKRSGKPKAHGRTHRRK